MALNPLTRDQKIALQIAGQLERIGDSLDILANQKLDEPRITTVEIEEIVQKLAIKHLNQTTDTY